MIAADVLRWFRLLRTHGLNHPTSGNASDRSGITKTGCNADDDLSLVDWDSPDRSQDAPIHQFCYEHSSDVQAILHAHSPYTASLGEFPFIEADWETEKHKIAEALVKYGLILHKDHGVYVAAESAQKAYETLCSLEHSSKISWIRRLI